MFKNFFSSLLYSLALVPLLSCDDNGKGQFLSNLNADASTPLYTTYAASMERSEYALDEGYELKYYNDSLGIEHATDTGGDIAVGFRCNGRWIYRVSDFATKPIVTRSYPDLASYYYYPAEGMRVNANFLVESSHSAVIELEILNESNAPIAFDLMPLMKNERNFFDSVTMDQTKSYFTFTHHELPDAWTIEHRLPYVPNIQNVFMASEPFDRAGTFNSLAGESVFPPTPESQRTEAIYRVTGRSKFTDGKRNQVLAPTSRIQIYLNNDRSRIITENSPIPGANQRVFGNDGYFTNELGNLKRVKNGDRFTFTFYHEGQNLSASYTKRIENADAKSERNDVVLKPCTLPLPPKNVTLCRQKRRNVVAWERTGESHQTYNVYRRDYPDGVYRLVAGNLTATSYADEPMDTNRVHGYIITSMEGKSMGIHSREVTDIDKVPFAECSTKGIFPENIISKNVKLICLSKRVELKPGRSKRFRFVRSVDRLGIPLSNTISKGSVLLGTDFNSYLKNNETLFSKVVAPQFSSKEQALLFWSANNLMRQVFLPAEAKSKYNYYVFSREPTWGWGHGGQVFHESITMLAYALLDPQSAMNSQRVYSQRQYENGYINYRTGSYLDEVIEYNNSLTSSAPWYSWINYEIFRITDDRQFLTEMYQSGKRFYTFFVNQRDKDNDGLCEWNGHAVLESVRDALVAVWDEVGWPSNFEGIDINSMLVMEAKSLEAMAMELGFADEAANWHKDWTTRADLINSTLWDRETGFYYNVNRTDHTFTFKNHNDLKRKEIVGFLPLWAGIVPESRLDSLLSHLYNPGEFWREYGIPTLSADDSYYNDKGYWNGPVWVQWNYLIVRGLLNYGHGDKAKELVDRVARNMIGQLKRDHNLWEFYSPDEQWAGYHKTYIWAGIINRMIIDSQNFTNKPAKTNDIKN